MPDGSDEPQPLVLMPYVAKYLQQRMRRGEMTPLTARNQRCALRLFAEVFGRRPVGRLGRRDVERYLESLDGLAPATRRYRFTAVRSFCRWLVLQRVIRRDPCAELRAPKEPRRIPRAMKADAVAQTLAACPDERARVIVLLMVQEGLRCVEVSRLQLGDVDRRTRVMRVVGKGGHERILPITEELAEELAGYLAVRGSEAGPLIRSYRIAGAGLAADTISQMVGRWMRDAGVKRAIRDGVSAHALRHTAATDMLLTGAHLRDVQHALGHAHLATTEVYLPYIVRGLEEAMGGRRYGD